MLHVFYTYTLKMEFAYMYSVAKFHKTPTSMNKEGIACFCNNNNKKYSYIFLIQLHWFPVNYMLTLKFYC